MSDLYDSDTDTDNDTQVQVRPTDNGDDEVTVVEDNTSPPTPPDDTEDTTTNEDNEKMKMIKANIPKLLELLEKNTEIQTTLYDMLNKPEEVKTDAASEVDFCSFQ